MYSNEGLLLDLMTYLIIEKENGGQYYPDFAFDHPLFSDGMHIYSDSKVCRFLKSVSLEQITGFLNDWNKKRDHKNHIYVSYDSTNKNCQAGDIDLVEYGKAKDEKGLPVFNLAIDAEISKVNDELAKLKAKEDALLEQLTKLQEKKQAEMKDSRIHGHILLYKV